MARAMIGALRSRLKPPSLNSWSDSPCELTPIIEAHVEARQERMSLARDAHVLGARETQLHRTPELGCRQCRHGRERVGLGFLASEGAAHAQALHHDLIARHTEHARDNLLGLRGVLGRRVNLDEVALVDHGQGRLSLQVEVLLPVQEAARLASDALRRRGLSPRRRVTSAPDR